MRLRVSNERRFVRCMLNGVRLCCVAQSLRGGKAALAFTGADVRGDPGGAVAPSGSASCEPKQKPLSKSSVIGIPGGTRGPDHAHKTKEGLRIGDAQADPWQVFLCSRLGSAHFGRMRRSRAGRVCKDSPYPKTAPIA